MKDAEETYKNKLKHGAVITKNYANCPKCNAINLFNAKDLIYEDEDKKYYHIKCWSCQKEFDT
jgi:transcription elongation factor Elf1